MQKAPPLGPQVTADSRADGARAGVQGAEDTPLDGTHPKKGRGNLPSRLAADERIHR